MAAICFRRVGGTSTMDQGHMEFHQDNIGSFHQADDEPEQDVIVPCTKEKTQKIHR